MTFRGRADRGGTHSHAGNSFCALETIVSAATDALRKIYSHGIINNSRDHFDGKTGIVNASFIDVFSESLSPEGGLDVLTVIAHQGNVLLDFTEQPGTFKHVSHHLLGQTKEAVFGADKSPDNSCVRVCVTTFEYYLSYRFFERVAVAKRPNSCPVGLEGVPDALLTEVELLDVSDR